jgi:CHAD domain-containing protein
MKGIQLKWDESRTVARNVRLQLTKASLHYFKAGRKMVRAEATPAELHAFRLQTKRFRYTLELFRPIYGPTLDRMIGSLRRIQQLLGEVNDCETARKLVRANGDPKSLQARRALRLLDRRQAERTVELGRVWLAFDREGAYARWVKYLDLYAGRPRRKTKP